MTSFWGFVGTLGGSFGLSQALVVTGKRQREKDLNGIADRLTAYVESSKRLPQEAWKPLARPGNASMPGDWRDV